MKIDYHPQASKELQEAAQFYESCQKGLGDRFLNAVEKALNVLQDDPLIWNADEFGRMKCGVKKFPYILIYQIRQSSIFILAVAHTSRKPGYWESRDTLM